MEILNKKKHAKGKATPKNPKDQAQPQMEAPNLLLVILNRYFRWILVLIVGLVFLLSYMFAIAGKIDDVQVAAQDNLPSKQKILNDLKAVKEDLDQVVIDFNAIRSLKSDVLNRLDLMIPEEIGQAELITMLDELTTSEGLTMNSINISMSESGGNRQQVDERFQEVGVPPAEFDQISTLTINLTVQGGTYESLKRYLDQIERNIRIFDIRSISFSGADFDVDQDGIPGVPSYTIELATYFKKIKS